MAGLSWSGNFQEPNPSMLAWLEQVRMANERGLPIPPPPPDAGLGASPFYMEPAPVSGAPTTQTLDPMAQAEQLAKRNRGLAPLANDQASALKDRR